MRILGERLRKLREGLNMTQVQIGEILGIPQTGIHRYENGSYTPMAETLVWYADYFDVSLDYIFGRADQPQGKLYDCKPEVLKLKEEQRREMEQFIEMRFDPKTEASRKIKSMMLELMEEKKK
ncbi:MAG: helix-turn-helix transcriptional regulator [Clostridia bacterium]|nr:helix-turn-helix transcriptional regulator [Clostridia bacterium]